MNGSELPTVVSRQKRLKKQRKNELKLLSVLQPVFPPTEVLLVSSRGSKSNGFRQESLAVMVLARSLTRPIRNTTSLTTRRPKMKSQFNFPRRLSTSRRATTNVLGLLL